MKTGRRFWSVLRFLQSIEYVVKNFNDRSRGRASAASSGMVALERQKGETESGWCLPITQELRRYLNSGIEQLKTTARLSERFSRQRVGPEILLKVKEEFGREA